MPGRYTSSSMTKVVTSELDQCLGKRQSLHLLHLGPEPSTPEPSSSEPDKSSGSNPSGSNPSPCKKRCTALARAEVASSICDAEAAAAVAAPATTPATTATTAAPTTDAMSALLPTAVPVDTNTTSDSPPLDLSCRPEPVTTATVDDNVRSESDAPSWETNLAPSFDFLPRKGPASDYDDVPGQSVDESCRRALDHFPSPAVAFPTPTLEFDFRVAVTLKPEPSQVQGRAHKEITAISSGNWSGSFGHGKVMAGGYDLGQARGFRPIRIVEGAFVMQTTDEPPAILEMRTRGSLSGPCDILDALLSPRNPKQIDPRKYGFRMFLTIKTADKRYAEIVNCGLWVASGVWKDDELIIDAYRVT